MKYIVLPEQIVEKALESLYYYADIIESFRLSSP